MSPAQKPNRNRKSPALGQSQTKPWVRVAVVVLVALVALGSLGAVLLRDGGTSQSTKVSAGSSSTTTAVPALASAAGKPCVAVADPLPVGAPAVPVTVGPPPAQLVTQDLQLGAGATVAPGSTITVDYIGVSCSTGKIFDTSYGRQPATFPLNNVVPGWRDGIPGMKVGGTRLLGIPPAQAYGAKGYPPDIAPDETLWFVVQVKSVQATG